MTWIAGWVAGILIFIGSIGTFIGFHTDVAIPLTPVPTVSTSTVSSATTTARVITPISVSAWKTYDFSNFSIPYPSDWVADESSNDVATNLIIEPSVAENADAPYFINIDVSNPNEYVNGPDELEENPYRRYMAAYSKTEEYLPLLNATSTIYASGPSETQDNENIIVFTAHGILIIRVANIRPNKIPPAVLDSIVQNIAFSKKISHPEYVAVPSTPKTYLGSHFSTDARQVYFYNQPILGADPNTFSFAVATSSYGPTSVIGKDATTVWYMSSSPEKVIGADPATFTLVGEEYAIDKSHVYFPDYIVGSKPECDGCAPETFTTIPGADPTTFTLMRASLAGVSDPLILGEDKNHVYVFGKVTTNAYQLSPYKK